MQPEFVRDELTLVALELEGEALDLDHGFPGPHHRPGATRRAPDEVAERTGGDSSENGDGATCTGRPSLADRPSGHRDRAAGHRAWHSRSTRCRRPDGLGIAAVAGRSAHHSRRTSWRWRAAPRASWRDASALRVPWLIVV